MNNDEKETQIMIESSKRVMKKIKIKDLIKDNFVRFNSYGVGFFYYLIDNPEDKTTYQFPIPLTDIGSGRMLDKDKAITYMRWIRKAIENNELIVYHDATTKV